MPISAVGNEPRAGRGFTLIELLVALVVVGVLTGLAALALPRGQDDAVRAEAARLAALLDAAREQAALGNTTIAWAPGSQGYTFLQASPRGWIPVDASPLVARAWQWEPAPPPATYAPRQPGAVVRARGVTVRVEGGAGAPGVPPNWLVFGHEPVSQPMRVQLQTADQDLSVLSDGIAPFSSPGAR